MPSKDTPERRASILASLKNGATYRIAAAKAGCSVKSLETWRKDDEEFNAQCEAAQAHFIQKQVERVDKAGNDDWKAASFLLQHHPISRPDFGQSQAKGQGGINIVLNIPRDTQEAQGLRQVFDASPKLEVTEGEVIEE